MQFTWNCKKKRRPLSLFVHSSELSAPDKESYDTFRLFYRRHSRGATSKFLGHNVIRNAEDGNIHELGISEISREPPSK